MRKSDVICSECGAGYGRIELATRPGKPGGFAVSFAIICLSISTALAKSLFVSPSSRRNIVMIVKTAFKLTNGVL